MRTETMTVLDRYPAAATLSLSGCPFFDRARQFCRVAAHPLNSGPGGRTGYCTTDEHDDCPLYLCQALRRSQPLGPDRESLVLSGK